MENKPSPLRRRESLRSLSREHHDGLLLCWKIRTGLRNHISDLRIAQYTRHFFITRLWPHFALEERELFPLLGENDLVKRAKEEHRRIGQLFLVPEPTGQTLELMQQLLEKHIRFEERVLFTELQEKVEEEVLKAAMNGHDTSAPEEAWEDMFWMSEKMPEC